MNATVLFETPQREISSLINARLSACHNASIVAGFLTPSGVRALAAPIRARPSLLTNLVIGSAMQHAIWKIAPARRDCGAIDGTGAVT